MKGKKDGGRKGSRLCTMPSSARCPSPLVFHHARCRSCPASLVLQQFPELSGLADADNAAEMPHDTAGSWPRSGCDDQGLICDEMLLEIMQRLPKEDILTLCLASTRKFGMAVWAVAQIHFRAELGGLVWRYTSAGTKAQVACEKFKAVQEVYREVTAAREMFLEDTFSMRRNFTRYELDLETMYENEQHFHIRHQAALYVLDESIKCWDIAKLEKDLFESWVCKFFQKAHCLRCCLAASDTSHSLNGLGLHA